MNSGSKLPRVPSDSENHVERSSVIYTQSKVTTFEQISASNRKPATEVESLMDKWRNAATLNSIYSEPFARIPFQTTAVGVNNNQKQQIDELAAELQQIGANSAKTDQKSTAQMVEEHFRSHSIGRNQQPSGQSEAQHNRMREESHPEHEFSEQAQTEDVQEEQILQHYAVQPAILTQSSVEMKLEPLTNESANILKVVDTLPAPPADQMIVETDEMIVKQGSRQSEQSQEEMEQSDKESDSGFKLRRMTTPTESAGTESSGAEEEVQDTRLPDVSVKPFQAFTEQKQHKHGEQDMQGTATTDDSTHEANHPCSSNYPSNEGNNMSSSKYDTEPLSCGMAASSHEPITMDLDKELQKLAEDSEPKGQTSLNIEEFGGVTQTESNKAKDTDIAFTEELIVVTNSASAKKDHNQRNHIRNLRTQFRKELDSKPNLARPATTRKPERIVTVRPASTERTLSNQPPSEQKKQIGKSTERIVMLGKRSELPALQPVLTSGDAFRLAGTPKKFQGGPFLRKQPSASDHETPSSRQGSAQIYRTSSPGNSHQLSRSSDKLSRKPSLPKFTNLAQSPSRTPGDPKLCKEIARRLAEAEKVLLQRKPPIPRFGLVPKETKKITHMDSEPSPLFKKPAVPKFSELLSKTSIRHSSNRSMEEQN